MQSIINLDTYWEEKVHINYQEELEKYKKVCGLCYKKKLINGFYSKNSNLISYKEWKQNITCMISILDFDELCEYSRFLNQKIRDFERTFILSQSLLIPFCIFLIGDLLKMSIEPIQEIKLIYHLDILIKFMAFLFLYVYIFKGRLEISISFN